MSVCLSVCRSGRSLQGQLLSGSMCAPLKSGWLFWPQVEWSETRHLPLSDAEVDYGNRPATEAIQLNGRDRSGTRQTVPSY